MVSPDTIISNPDNPVAPNRVGENIAFIKHFEKLLSPNEYIRCLQEMALMTTRHPNPDNKQEQVLCPTVESMPLQFLHLVSNTDGKINEIKLKEVSSRIRDFGQMFYADGIKVQAASGAKKQLGDLYIITNLDILHRAANELKCDLIYGIYSGDENCGIILIPREDSKIKDREALKKDFEQACKEKTKETYQNPNHPHSKFFQEMQSNVTMSHPQEKLGFTLYTDILEGHDIPKPAQHKAIRLRTLVAAILDLARGKKLPPAKYSASLVDSLLATLQLPLTSHHKVDDIKGKIPQNILQYYRLARAVPDVDQDALLGLVEKAVFEPIFPRELNVRKISNLVEDIQDGIAQNYKYRLVSFANTNVKPKNNESHIKGDNEIIAGFNVMQRYVNEAYQTHPLAKSLDSTSIRYYKNQGSGYILIEENLYNLIEGDIKDVLAINTDIIRQESARLLKDSLPDGSQPNDNISYRAHPFIVTTCSDYPINNENFNEDTFWQHIDQELRPKQTRRETLYLLMASGLIIPIGNEIVDILQDELKVTNQSIEAYRRHISLAHMHLMTSDQTVTEKIRQGFQNLVRVFVSLFGDAVEVRPERLPQAKEALNKINSFLDLETLSQFRRNSSSSPTSP